METATVLLIIALVVVLAVLIVVMAVALRRRSAVPTGFGADELRALLAESFAERSAVGAQRPDDIESPPDLGTAEKAHATHTVGAAAPDPTDRDALVEPAMGALQRAQQADLVTKRAAADADGIRHKALAEAESIRQQARTDAEVERVKLDSKRARVAEESQSLAGEQRAIAAEQERLRSDRTDVVRQRSDIAEREQALRERMAASDSRQITLDQNRIEIDAGQLKLDQAREALAAESTNQRKSHEAELARISSLTVDAARAELLASQEESIRRDAALMMRRIETEAQTTAKERARRIVADAIQRVASDQTSQSVVSVLQLPSDELKGRIIGREGRNIRAFETVTGVNVIIDDTPEAVLLSCFDPVRREIGRVTLQALIDDGRIHPHRIEEAYDRACEEVEALCARAAEDALLEVGISDLHPALAVLVGQLKYRTSYGQNVLGHVIETSHIARMMAAELGVDPVVVARGAFLHDIGKALTHEAQGSHAIVGAAIARKYGESQDVAHCIEAHHDEVPPATVEAVLTQAADACSGGRPGARRESLESYVKRLEHIEAIASAKKGVEKVFAMQAGRELRVMVKPNLVDDLEAQVMAREVAKQIEEELTYPGQVRVTVIRESRATEIAR
ncbi:MAG: ribonuclease Y [Nakamurella sp.]